VSRYAVDKAASSETTLQSRKELIMKTTRTVVALAAFSLLGVATLARAAGDSYHWTHALASDDLYNWPQRAAASPTAEKRTDRTIYLPSGAAAGTPERAADDAFYYRHSGGVPG
jgi:hypothetical protein